MTLVRRDDGSKTQVALGAVAAATGTALEEMQGAMLQQALDFREAHTAHVASVDEVLEAAPDGFAVVPWSAVGPEGEDRLAAKAVTVRCLQRPDGSLADNADEAGLVAICGRAY